MSSSWYSISIYLQNSVTTIFTGYFKVDNTTNLVTSFYETINGLTNFNNNILIPTGTGSISGTYLGFNYYNASYYIFTHHYYRHFVDVLLGIAFMGV